jgi:uncharacterized protein (UPF0248 family)
MRRRPVGTDTRKLATPATIVEAIKTVMLDDDEVGVPVAVGINKKDLLISVVVPQHAIFGLSSISLETSLLHWCGLVYVSHNDTIPANRILKIRSSRHVRTVTARNMLFHVE